MEHVNSVTLIGEICSEAKITMRDTKHHRHIVTFDILVKRKTLTSDGVFKVGTQKQKFTIRIVDQKAREIRPYLSLYEEGKTVELRGELIEVVDDNKRLAAVIVNQPDHCFEIRMTPAEMLEMQDAQAALSFDDILRAEEGVNDSQPSVEHQAPALQDTTSFDDEANAYYAEVMNRADSMESMETEYLTDDEAKAPQQETEVKASPVVEEMAKAPTCNKVMNAFLAHQTVKEVQNLPSGAVIEEKKVLKPRQTPMNQPAVEAVVATRQQTPVHNKPEISHTESPLATGYNVQAFLN